MSRQGCKLEDPNRLRELNPKKRLEEAGFQEGMALCDVGAGTGIFTFAAAEISKEPIYALELSEERLGILEEKKSLDDVEQVVIKQGDDNSIPLPNHSCDFVLFVTVFHEIGRKVQMLKEVKRVLKPGGKLMVIEFHEQETPLGPPVQYRISQETVEEMATENGFKVVLSDILGENFYRLVFMVR